MSLQLGKGHPEAHGQGFEPDAIILDSCDLGGRAGISVLALLRDHPSARIICMNAEDDKLEVYRKDQRVAKKREELVAAIRSG